MHIKIGGVSGQVHDIKSRCMAYECRTHWKGKDWMSHSSSAVSQPTGASLRFLQMEGMFILHFAMFCYKDDNG